MLRIGYKLLVVLALKTGNTEAERNGSRRRAGNQKKGSTSIRSVRGQTTPTDDGIGGTNRKSRVLILFADCFIHEVSTRFALAAVVRCNNAVKDILGGGGGGALDVL